MIVALFPIGHVQGLNLVDKMGHVDIRKNEELLVVDDKEQPPGPLGSAPADQPVPIAVLIRDSRSWIRLIISSKAGGSSRNIPLLIICP